MDKSGIGNETNVKTKIPAEIPKAGPMVADADGNLYIADSSKCSIIKVTPSGEASLFAGHSRTCPDAGIQPKDGSGDQAEFIYPNAITIDSAGNIYVADNIPINYEGIKIKGSSIRKITPDGVVTRLAGSFSDTGYIDASGENAKFSGISGLATDNEGGIYGADTYSHAIRKITPSGDVSTFLDLLPLYGIPLSVLHDGSSGLYTLYTNGLGHVVIYKNNYNIDRLSFFPDQVNIIDGWQIDKNSGDIYFLWVDGKNSRRVIFQFNRTNRKALPVGNPINLDATIAVLSSGMLAILDNGKIIKITLETSTH